MNNRVGDGTRLPRYPVAEWNQHEAMLHVSHDRSQQQYDGRLASRDSICCWLPATVCMELYRSSEERADSHGHQNHEVLLTTSPSSTCQKWVDLELAQSNYAENFDFDDELNFMRYFPA